MSRSPRFLGQPNPTPLFSNLSFPNDATEFVIYAHTLFSKSAEAISLLTEIRGMITVSFSNDEDLPSFGFFTDSKIYIRNSLNNFEKTMVLLFELCNLVNPTLNKLTFEKNHDDPSTFAEACERAEFLSLTRAAHIYESAAAKNLWPDFKNEFEAMREFGELLHMNEEDYLAWTKKPRPELLGKSHISHYESLIKNKASVKSSAPTL